MLKMRTRRYAQAQSTRVSHSAAFTLPLSDLNVSGG